MTGTLADPSRSRHPAQGEVEVREVRGVDLELVSLLHSEHRLLVSLFIRRRSCLGGAVCERGSAACLSFLTRLFVRASVLLLPSTSVNAGRFVHTARSLQSFVVVVSPPVPVVIDEEAVCIRRDLYCGRRAAARRCHASHQYRLRFTCDRYWYFAHRRAAAQDVRDRL